MNGRIVINVSLITQLEGTAFKKRSEDSGR